VKREIKSHEGCGQIEICFAFRGFLFLGRPFFSLGKNGLCGPE